MLEPVLINKKYGGKTPKRIRRGGSAKRVVGAVKKFINIRDVIENWSKGTITDMPVSGDDMYCEDPDPISFEPFQVGDNVIMQNKTKHCFKEKGMQKWLQRKQVNPLTNMPLSQKEIDFVGIDKTPPRVVATLRIRNMFALEDYGVLHEEEWTFDDERMNQSIIEWAKTHGQWIIQWQNRYGNGDNVNWVSANDAMVQPTHTFSQYNDFTVFPGLYVRDGPDFLVENRNHQRTFYIRVVVYTNNTFPVMVTPFRQQHNETATDEGFEITLELCKEPKTVKKLLSYLNPQHFLETNEEFEVPKDRMFRDVVTNYHTDWNNERGLRTLRSGTWYGSNTPEFGYEFLALKTSIENNKTGIRNGEQIDLENFSQKLDTTLFRVFHNSKKPKSANELTRDCLMKWYGYQRTDNMLKIQLVEHSGHDMYPKNI